jgi:hypothetical protein
MSHDTNGPPPHQAKGGRVEEGWISPFINTNPIFEKWA